MDRARTLRLAAGAIGFGVGSAAGAVALWLVGYYAFVSPIRGTFAAPLYLLSLFAFVFGLVSPLTLVLYFGRNLHGLARLAVIALGYLLLVGFLFALAALRVLQTLGVTTALEAIALLDAVSGFTVGGILGKTAAERLLR